MNTSRFTATFLVLLASTVMLYGRSASTGWSALNMFIGNAYEKYAKAHDGELPSSWDDLEPYWNSFAVESGTGLKIRENTYIFDRAATLPHVDYTGKLLAMSASVIIEERRPEKGRYVVYRAGDETGNWEIGTKWLAESVIQAAARKANVPAPSTGDYHDTSVIAAKQYEGPIPAPGAAPPPPPDPNAPYKFPDTPPIRDYGFNGEPLSMPVQPVQGTARLGPTTTFDGSYYGYAAAGALLALLATGIWFYRHRHSERAAR